MHVTKGKSSIKVYHLLYKFLLLDKFECQAPSQRRCEGFERQIISGFTRDKPAESEVLEILEEPDEEQDLHTRTFGFVESEGLKSFCAVIKTPPELWQRIGQLQTVYPKLPKVFELVKVFEVAPVERSPESEERESLEMQLLDKGGQTKLPFFFQGLRPLLPLRLVADCKRVVETGRSSDIPHSAYHRAHAEGVEIVNVGDDEMYNIWHEFYAPPLFPPEKYAKKPVHLGCGETRIVVRLLEFRTFICEVQLVQAAYRSKCTRINYTTYHPYRKLRTDPSRALQKTLLSTS